MGPQKNLVKNLNKRPGRHIVKLLAILLLAVCAVSFADWLIEDGGTWEPNYPETDLSKIVSRPDWTEADYHTIFLQTGLAKDAADAIMEKKTGINRIKVFEKYQSDFFAPKNYTCMVDVVIVHDERLTDDEGNMKKGFEIADLQDGDILITKATHSLGWRHGHASIVTDADEGETLEAVVLGQPTLFMNVSKWQTYPSFIQLRLKDKNADPAKIAAYAKEKMQGVPYGLLTGIPVKAPEKIKKTQCAHVVWYPFEHFGYDIDSDGSWLVTPKDIVNSDLLEVVQVYGVNPEEIWR
jgi:uncharacterized protein YycO